jgi:hypothetical protein
LEEIFQVPMSEVQLPAKPDLHEGILMLNGHLNPYVEPLFDAWKDEQREVHGRAFSVMPIESIVSMVLRHALVGDLRQALAEVGLEA